MKSQLKWLATAMCAVAWSVCSYATEITVDNFTAVQSVTNDAGGNYAYFQFALNDSRMATSDGLTLADEVVVSKIAVGQRNGTSYSIAEGSWLLIQEVTTLGSNNLGGTLGVTVATTAPLTAEGKTANVTVGTGTKTLTLCTWTLTTPVRLSKSKTYRATFYNASNASASQQLEMVSISGTTDNTNTKIHASGDANYSPYVRVTVTDEALADGVAKSATLTEDGAWSNLPWDPTGTPAIADTVTLSADAARTVTLADDVTISGLTLSGSGSFNFAAASGQAPRLIAYATAVNADTDVSAISAHLGAVTLASGKTLTVAPSVGYGSLTSGTSSSGANDASKVIVDATTSALSVGTNDTRSAALKNFAGVVEFQGSGSTGATVEFGYANGDQAFKPRFIFKGGTHTMKYGCNNNLFSPGGTDAKPTISVTEGAALAFRFKDLSGWSDSTGETASVIRVGEASSLELLGNNETTPSSSNTGYFRDRILLDSGASVTNSHPKFYFYGGTSNLAQLAMLDNQGTATWNGGFETKGEMKIDIGSASTLGLNGVVSGSHAVTKAGAGTLTLTGVNTKSGTLTISAGTVKLQDAASWAGAIANSGTLEIANATDKTLSNTISGAGTVKKSGAGTLALTGTMSSFTGNVEAAEGTLDVRSATLGATLPSFKVASGANLILNAGQEGTMTVPAGATLTLVLSEAQLALAYASHATIEGTVVFKKVVDGALSDVTETDGSVAGGTFTANLNTWTAPAEGEATWANAACWSQGLPASGDSVRVLVSAADTTLTVGEAATVAKLLVAGSGSLTLAGDAALTVTDEATFLVNTTAEKSKLLVTNTIQIDSGVTLTLSSDESEAPLTTNPDPVGTSSPFALPALTGSGTLAKEGTGYVALFTTVAEPTIHVKSGALFMRATSNDTLTNTHALTVEVDDGATLKFAGWSTSFTNSLNSFKLKGGSKTILGNGVGGGTTQIAGTITVAEASDENPARIYGSAFGEVILATAITGEGTLEFAEGERFNENYKCDNQVTVSGIISGSLKIRNADDNIVKFSGANDYTGGTEIAKDATLAIANGNILGTTANIIGSGTIETPVLPSCNLTNENWTGTLRLTTSCTSQTDMDWSNYGNANSFFEIPEGKAISGHFKNATLTFNVKFVLNGSVTIDNGYSGTNGNTYTFTGALTGSGTFTLSGNNTAAIAFLLQKADGFGGTLSVANETNLKKAFIVGPGTHSYSSSNDGGKIIVTGSVTNAAVKNWSAKNGISVEGALTLTGEQAEVPGAMAIQSGGSVVVDTTGATALQGAISGAGKLEVAANKAATLTGNLANFTGALKVGESGSLTLDTTSTLTLGGNLEGAGALNLGGSNGSPTVALSGFNGGYNGVITVASNATLTNAGSSATVPFGKGSIENNGTVKLMSTTGTDGQLPPTFGSGDVVVTASCKIPAALTVKGSLTVGENCTVTLDCNTDGLGNQDFKEATPAIDGPSVSLATGATIALGTNKTTGSITIAAGRSLSGNGTINVPVAFENEITATVAADANLTFGSTLTVPKNVTLPGKVTLASTAVISGAGELSGAVTFAAGATIDATASTVEQMLTLSGTPTFAEAIPVKVARLCSLFSVPSTVSLTAEQVSLTWAGSAIAGSKVMLSTITSVTTAHLFVPPKTPTASEENPRDAGVDEAITKAAEMWASWNYMISEVTAITATGTDGKSAREVNAAALFENVLTLVPGKTNSDGSVTATATVAYDFGVADMTIRDLTLAGDTEATRYVLLAAKVQNSASSNTAEFASGVTLTVMNGEAELTPKVVSAAEATGVVGAAETTGVKWLAIPLKTLFPDGAPTGTQPLKVKASKVAASN
ncbi:MAG: beta strand repeat-containing protein [Candidatus Spyradenecus sp.]